MRLLLALVVGSVLAAGLTGWGRSAGPEGDGRDAAAARTVRAVVAGAPVAGAPDAAQPPAGRTRCSSPFGATRFGFDAACARHDAGYAVLRSAGERGRPLGPWARRAVDARFAADLAHRCAGAPCRAAAVVYADAVRVNSWRQGDGPPVVEDGTRVAAAALPAAAAVPLVAAGLGPAAVLPLRVRRRAARALRRAGDPRVLAAATALAATVPPGLVPHPVGVRVVIGAAAAASGWAVGAAARRAVALVAAVRGRTARQVAVPPRAAVALLVALGVLVVVADRARALQAAGLGTPVPGPAATAAHLAGGAVLAALVVAPVHALLRSARRAAAVCAVLAVGASPAVSPAAAAAAVPAGPPAAVVTSAAPAAAGPGSQAARFVGSAEAGALRVYASRGAADDPSARAERAVDAFVRAGGLDRGVVLLAVPTGSGWVNPQAVGALERQRHGDVATLAVQYAEAPSWVVYLRGGERVDVQVRTLAAALAGRVRALPPQRRPRVLAYGESLGAWGGRRAAGAGGLPDGVDGALWVAAPPGAPRPAPATGCPGARLHANPDDPVPGWSPALAVRPRGGGPWLPLLTFWRATADVIAAQGVPAGHGHRYGPELTTAWQALAGAPCPPPGGASGRFS